MANTDSRHTSSSWRDQPEGTRQPQRHRETSRPTRPPQPGPAKRAAGEPPRGTAQRVPVRPGQRPVSGPAGRPLPPRRPAQAKRPRGGVRAFLSEMPKMPLLMGAGAAVIGIIILALLMSTNVKPAEKAVYVIEERVDQIRGWADQFGLDPAYVAAVVMAESGYDENSCSEVNAQGLMQILPETGEWIAGKFDETYVEGSLYDPDTSLKYGCWYLAWLMDRYNNSMICASSAYHQGQGTVDKWLTDPEYNWDGTVENMPSEATATYVGRILKYYDKYKEIYAQAA